MLDQLRFWLGIDTSSLGIWQTLLRTVIVFFVSLLAIRFGKKRLLGKSTTLDVVIAITFGSLMSRAISKEGYFFELIAAGSLLIFLHWLVSWFAYRYDFLGRVFKGTDRVLIKDGVVDEVAMRKSLVSQHDLTSALRGCGIADINEIADAHLERNGEISLIKKPSTGARDSSGS